MKDRTRTVIRDRKWKTEKKGETKSDFAPLCLLRSFEFCDDSVGFGSRSKTLKFRNKRRKLSGFFFGTRSKNISWEGLDVEMSYKQK